MQAQRLNPAMLVQQVLADTRRHVSQANQGNAVLSHADIERLPTGLQTVVGELKSAGADRVATEQLLDVVRERLERGLLGHPAGEALTSAALSDEVRNLIATSPLGILALQLADSDRPEPDLAQAEAALKGALRHAGADVTAQVALLEAMQATLGAYEREQPKSETSLRLRQLVDDRAHLMRRSVDAALVQAELAFGDGGDETQRRGLQRTLHAAQQVHGAVNPRSSRLKGLRERAAELGFVGGADAGQARPFFARFLEQQHRQAPAPRPDDVTQKFPSDAEDGGAGGPAEPGFVTEKFPSDGEDGGDAGPDGPGAVTEKYPSDAEDGSIEPGDLVTLKFPSDGEDDGAVGDDAIAVTEKYPSDAEDSGVDGPDEPGFVTEKYPSDAEDGGLDGPGDIVTAKFPSDAEDG